jgi:hypothetical protein
VDSEVGAARRAIKAINDRTLQERPRSSYIALSCAMTCSDSRPTPKEWAAVPTLSG